MTRLIVCRGLPGSGKTTRARAWVAEDPAGRTRVNRDDLRRMLHDGVYLGRDTERQIISARDVLVRSLLAKGLDVVCDDTNLPQRVARDVARVGRLAGAEVEVWDMTDVPLDVCMERDAARERSVGEDVIRGMHARFLAGRAHPLPDSSEDDAPGTGEPYSPRVGTPPAVIVDIDGTCALHSGRSPFDESLVHTDVPNAPVVDLVRLLSRAGYHLVFCSGRTSACRGATLRWLREHVGEQYIDGTIDLPGSTLLMRAEDDKRKDSVVKLELFDRHVRDAWSVRLVLDDRDSVVVMWRSLGLTVLQVAEGNF